MHKFICTLFLTTVCCLSLFSNSITVEILELEDTECFGEDSGFIILEASDGVAPYSFDLNGDVNNSGEFEDLAAGNYSVVVTDQSGCSETIMFEIEAPDEIIVTTSEVNDTGCEGVTNGSFQLVTSGGAGNYIYTLGSEVNTTGLFENLAAGTYEPLVEDDNGCESTIMVVIEQDCRLRRLTKRMSIALATAREAFNCKRQMVKHLMNIELAQLLIPRAYLKIWQQGLIPF